jgi:phosphoribosyl 1,2-cyclic phosphate phosphodiesterase
VTAPRVTTTLLGTGTSTGVPVVGCVCGVCTSADPRDRRLRASALLTIQPPPPDEPLRLLIDAGPDLRQQALRAGLARLDGVLVTHHHFDHIGGLDDLRPFLFDNRTPIPVYASAETAGRLRRAFPYAFVGEGERYPGAPRLDLVEVEAGTPFAVASRYGGAAQVQVLPIGVFHGELPILGYRIGQTAYLTDVSRIPDAAYQAVAGVDVLVVSALRHEPHQTHFTFEQAVQAARRIGARQTVFTHISHNTSHADIAAFAPADIAPGYDGLSLTDGSGEVGGAGEALRSARSA